jgi:hypothetical protein
MAHAARNDAMMQASCRTRGSRIAGEARRSRSPASHSEKCTASRNCKVCPLYQTRPNIYCAANIHSGFYGLRLLAWNIRQGGDSRLPRVADALARHEADVLVLSEYRRGEAAVRLRAAIAVLGYRYVTAVEPPPGRSGVLIAAPAGSWRPGAGSASTRF